MIDPADDIGDWLQAHARQVSIGAILVLGIAAAGWLYYTSSEKRAQEADAALTGPEQSIAAGNIPLAQADLKRVISRYDGTAAATQAAILLAQTYYDQQKYTDGIKVLDEASTSGDAKAYASTVAAVKGAGYSQSGKYKEAAEAYTEAAKLTKYPIEQSVDKANAARAYTSAGDITNAVALWQELASADPPSPEGPEARLHLGELTAKPAGK
jgi:predicted negative regulator of RcsB-dependent stress response